MLQKNPIKMKALIKHKGYDNLFIVQKESPDEKKALVRAFLSDTKFDMDIEQEIKNGSIKFVGRDELENIVNGIVSVLDKIYSSGKSALITVTSNTILIPEGKDTDVNRKNVRNLFSEWINGQYSILETKYRFVDKDYVLKRIINEYMDIVGIYIFVGLNRANTPSGEFKNDRLDDKLRWELLPMEEVEDIVKVFHYGAKKYAPDSWKNIPDGFERYRAALMRHMMAYLKGERIDPESGLQHLAQVAWNAIAMLYYDKHDMGKFPNVTSDPNEGCVEERSKSFRKK